MSEGQSLSSILDSRNERLAIPKLKKYISQSLVSGFDSRALRRDFYDKGFIRLLERLYGEGRNSQTPWIESVTGKRFWDYKKARETKDREELSSWNRDRDSILTAQAALDLVEILGVGETKPHAIMGSLATRKRFPFPVEYLPKPSVRLIRSGVVQYDALLVHLLDREFRDTGLRTVPKPSTTTLHLSFVETCLLYFLHYPVSRSRKGRTKSSYTRNATRSALAPSLTPSLVTQSSTVAIPLSTVQSTYTPLPLLFRAVRSLKGRSPHMSSFWLYMEHFLPYESMGDPKPDSDLFFLATVAFWLRTNDPRLVAMPGQSSSAREYSGDLPDMDVFSGGLGVRGVSTGSGSGLVAGVGSSGRLEYDPPEEEGLEGIVVMLTYLFNDPLLLRCVSGARAGAQSLLPFGTESGDTSNVRLTPLLQALQQPLFHYLRIHLERYTLSSTPGLFEKVVDTWLAYLTPWRARDRLKDRVWIPPHVTTSGPRTFSAFKGFGWSTASSLSRSFGGGGSKKSGSGAGAGAGSGSGGGRSRSGSGSGMPTAEWQDFGCSRYQGYGDWEAFVILNYMFYVHLLGIFLRRLSSCDFSSNDSTLFDMLERVLDVFEPRVMDTLMDCAGVIEEMYPAGRHRHRHHRHGRHGRRSARRHINTPSVTGPRGRFIRGLLEQHHAMLQLELPFDDTLGQYATHASMLIDRLRLGLLSSSSSRSRRQNDPRQLERTFQRRGGAGWCDGLIERALRVWFNVSSIKVSTKKGPKHIRVTGATERLAGMFQLESKLTSSPDGGPEDPAPDTQLVPRRRADRLSSGALTVATPDKRADGLLSAAGRAQLHDGKRACSALDVGFQGPEGARPVTSMEIGWLVRLIQRLAIVLHCLWGDPAMSAEGPSAHIRAMLEAQDEVHRLHASGQNHTMGWMRLQAARPGPPKTYLRVFADIRVALPTAVLYILSAVSVLGAWYAMVFTGVWVLALLVLV